MKRNHETVINKAKLWPKSLFREMNKCHLILFIALRLAFQNSFLRSIELSELRKMSNLVMSKIFSCLL